MKESVFLEGIKRLEAAFRNGNETSESTLKLYWERLKYLNDDEFTRHIENLIDHSDRWPAISKLKEARRTVQL